jgi:hypothetical protein
MEKSVRRLILTGWCGLAHGAMAAYTLHPMYRYAKIHGCDVDCLNLATSAAPPSWMKVPALIVALEEYDEVLWMDCDVVVSRSQENIFDELPAGSWQGMVVHQTECGEVPNCGVWLVRKAMRDTLLEMWSEDLAEYKDHCWWEQGAMLRRLGYEVSAGPVSVDRGPTPLREHSAALHAKWNHHPRDEGRVETPNFHHVTQYEDRVGEARRLCERAD